MKHAIPRLSRHVNFILAAVAALCGLAACSSTGSLSPALVQAGTSIVTAEAIFRGVAPADRPAVARKVYSFASAARSLATGQAPDWQVFAATLDAWSGGDPALALVARNLVNAYRANFAQIQARNPNSVALFEGIAQGIEDAAAIYLPAQPVVVAQRA